MTTGSAFRHFDTSCCHRRAFCEGQAGASLATSQVSLGFSLAAPCRKSTVTAFSPILSFPSHAGDQAIWCFPSSFPQDSWNVHSLRLQLVCVVAGEALHSEPKSARRVQKSSKLSETQCCSTFSYHFGPVCAVELCFDRPSEVGESQSASLCGGHMCLGCSESSLQHELPASAAPSSQTSQTVVLCGVLCRLW